MKNNPENLVLYSHFDQIVKRFIPGNPPYSTLKFVTDFPPNKPPNAELHREDKPVYPKDIIDIARLNKGEIPRQDMMWPLLTRTPDRPLRLPFFGVLSFKSPSDYECASFSGITYPSTVTDGRENLYHISNIFFFDPDGFALKAEQLTFLAPLSHQRTFAEKINGWMNDPGMLGYINFHPQANETTNYTDLERGDYEKMWAAIDYINSGRATLKFSSDHPE
jgi:hypothetical protein